MLFHKEQIYHIYNRGNNKETIFFERRNYNFFIEKIENHICKFSELLAFCLMPNHFHILIYTDNNFETEKLNENIAVLLRSYTRAIKIGQVLFSSKRQRRKMCLNTV